MNINKNKEYKIFNKVSIILSIFILLFGLPFYFGYGLPLPESSYSFLENFWLLSFPVIFLSLILGFKYKKLSGIILVSLLFIGLLFTLIIEKEYLLFMNLPLFVGVLNLIIGFYYNK